MENLEELILKKIDDMKDEIIKAHCFQERGIETILIGRGRNDTNAHAADEFVYIEDLINTTKLYALTALNYLK